MKYIFIASTLLVTFFSCKKDKPDTPTDPTQPTETTGTTEQLIADSIYLFSKEIYYWQDKIAASSYSSFNPRQYVITGDALATADSVIAKIRNFNVYDQQKRYSFAEPYTGSGTSATTPETGYGFDVKDAWKNRVIPTSPVSLSNFQGWYVDYVYPNSNAGQQGVQRGMKLVKVNGTILGYDKTAETILNNMFYYETLKSVDAQFVKTDGDTLKITITDNSYTPSSVLYSNVFTTPGGNKVGYLVYKFFDDLTSSSSALDAAFQFFKNQAVSSIILDMRYNNGVYTTTQDYLTNHVAPASSDGSIMYRYYFNSNLQTGNYTVLKSRYPNYLSFSLNNSGNTVRFGTAPTSLNTPKVYVIVGAGTASASELFINNLKPALGNNLVLIGDDNTYGKPVGFFPIDLFKKVTFWAVSLMTRNSLNDSVSYAGFSPNYRVYDGVDKSWGDVTEDCTAAAITLIDGGAVTIKSASQTLPRSVQPLPRIKLMRKERLMDNMLLQRRY